MFISPLEIFHKSAQKGRDVPSYKEASLGPLLTLFWEHPHAKVKLTPIGSAYVLNIMLVSIRCDGHLKSPLHVLIDASLHAHTWRLLPHAHKKKRLKVTWGETTRVFQLAPQGDGLVGLVSRSQSFYLFDIMSFPNIHIFKVTWGKYNTYMIISICNIPRILCISNKWNTWASYVKWADWWPKCQICCGVSNSFFFRNWFSLGKFCS